MTREPPPLASPPLIAAHDLSIQAGARRLAEHLSFEARAGEFWCVIGANGAGKTTLLHTLAGFAPPAAGRIELAGRALDRWRSGEAACVRGLLPQGADALYGISVLQAVTLGRHPHQTGRWWQRLGDDESDLAAARVALALVDLDALADRDIQSLSGGERQRVAIASLLAQNPLVWLLDEPLSSLDLKHQVATMALLQAQARGGRLIVVSLHDLSLAARYASHVLVLGADGRVHHGAAADLLTSAVLSEAFAHPIQRVGDLTTAAFVAA